MIVNGIDTKDISVIVQGAVTRGIIELCLESIRKNLPEAEIILSTWEGTDVEGLDFDVVLLNKDPGGFDFFNAEYSQVCNYERQRVSTVNGLKKAKGKYAVKIRTDFMLQSDNFLYYYGKYKAKNIDFSFLREKVICCELFSRNPLLKVEGWSHVIHPSDIFYFGLLEDLLCIFDSPSIEEVDKIYFSHKYPDKMVMLLSRFVPEQYLWKGFLRKFVKEDNLPLDLEDLSDSAVKLTEKSFASNLIILSNQKIGLKSLKNSIYSKEQILYNCYSHFDWFCLYLFYCKKMRILYYMFRLKCLIKNCEFKIERNIENVYFDLKKNIHLKGIAKKILKKLISFIKQQRGMGKNCIESFLNSGVKDDDISVIVQGAISDKTADCLKSIRKTLPGAEIILSTWEGEKVENLDYDILVMSKDPGANGLIRRYPHLQFHNVNREIVSTYAGLCSAHKYYCMKLRSDMKIENSKFLDYYNKYSQYLSPNAIFDRRVMVEGFCTVTLQAFSVGDWWYFGAKQDLKKIFNIPLYQKEDIPYFEEKENLKKKPFGTEVICRFIPEQYIIYQCLLKHSSQYTRSQLNYDHVYDNSEQSVQLTEEFIANNLLCLEFPLSGVVLTKAKNMDNPTNYRYATPFVRWLELCKKRGTLPERLVKRSEEHKYDRECDYIKNSQYNDIQNCSAIIKNYSNLEYQIKDAVAERINKSDITFVVCGRIMQKGEFNTNNCLSSIRRFFSESKIILVSWEGQKIEHLVGLYDELVILKESKEPFLDIYVKENLIHKENSLNKQQYSVHEGMCRVKTKYAVRVRTDFYFYNDNFLFFYLRWQRILDKTDIRYKTFKQKILVFDYYMRDPRAYAGGYAYMLSDCFQFGLTEDLLQLWDGHTESYETFNYFNDHMDSEYLNVDRFNTLYNAEQYFFLNLLRNKKINVSFPDYYNDCSEIYTFENDKIVSSNIIIGNWMQLGIKCKFLALEDKPIFYSVEKVVERYLYNIDPDNRECLEYLENFYGNKNSEIKGIRTNKKMTKQNLFIRKSLKKVMRLLFPAYRVGDDVRKMVREWKKCEEERLNILSQDIRVLQEEIRDIRNEIEK